MIFLLLFWHGYWKYSERHADKQRPKTAGHLKKYSLQWFARCILTTLYFLLPLQLMGFSIFPFSAQTPGQLLGLLLALFGFFLSVWARKALGVNWAHAAEYQVKKKQELITRGIYHYVRHPIYTGIACMLIGSELVAKSWLWFFLMPLLFVGAYLQGKREEKLLVSHFGDEYKNYMKRSKMLVPFVY